MTTWEDHTRDNQYQVQVNAAGQAFITFENETPGQLWELQQLTTYTLNHSVQGMSILKGAGDSQQLICTTPVFGQVNSPVLQATASATAVGPPYVYLQTGESVTATVWGATPGDEFYLYYIWRLGVNY